MGARPIALTIAGSDSSGGAGIQADLKTFSALGIYGASVLTALTAQNTRGVQAVEMMAAPFVEAQMASVFDDLAVGAVKTGMLGTAAIIAAVAARLASFPGPAVVDPVMVATSGDMLIQEDAVAVLKRELIPVARLITPNLDEAAKLTGGAVATSIEAMTAQGRQLIAEGAQAVLMKGGHFGGDGADDLLVTPDGAELIEGRRIATNNTHGTGCTLSAAIAAHLAAGADLSSAVKRGKAYLTGALEGADALGVGAGHGPVDHLFGIAPPLDR
jgi:hydroxymethylpyrimidine/phosphomethylpyrimidine kinase